MRSCRIITGGKGTGKTTRAAAYRHGASGFLTVSVPDGYVLRTVESGREWPLMSALPIYPCRIGRWSYDQAVFDMANEHLLSLDQGVIIIDEVGRLECGGGGFAPALKVLAERDVDLIITVRDEFLDSVREAFSIADAVIEGVEASS